MVVPRCRLRACGLRSPRRRIGTRPVAISGRMFAFGLVIVGAPLMPAPMRATRLVQRRFSGPTLVPPLRFSSAPHASPAAPVLAARRAGRRLLDPGRADVAGEAQA